MANTLVYKSSLSAPQYFLRLTRSHEKNKQGLELLRLELWEADLVKRTCRALDHVTVVSGQPFAQEFRAASVSEPGSFEPIPEGHYWVGLAVWASGRPGDYSTLWSTALGPVVLDITNAPDNNTRRAELRFHQDANASTSPGTAGCIGCQGVKSDFDYDRLKTIISWRTLYKVSHLEVDYELGSFSPWLLKVA